MPDQLHDLVLAGLGLDARRVAQVRGSRRVALPVALHDDAHAEHVEVALRRFAEDVVREAGTQREQEQLAAVEAHALAPVLGATVDDERVRA